MVETMDKEEEVDTALERRYPTRQRQKKYDQTFQGKCYKDASRAMLINCEDTL